MEQENKYQIRCRYCGEATAFSDWPPQDDIGCPYCGAGGIDDMEEGRADWPILPDEDEEKK
jgi:DNA-directed RNA polymerase subunit RPC12/RpoP